MGVIYHASLPNLERSETGKKAEWLKESLQYLFCSSSLSLSLTHTLSLSLSHTHTLSLSHTKKRRHAHTHTLSISLFLSLTHTHKQTRTLTHTLTHTHTQTHYLTLECLPLQFHPIRPAFIFVHAWLKYKRGEREKKFFCEFFLFKYLNEWLDLIKLSFDLLCESTGTKTKA